MLIGSCLFLAHDPRVKDPLHRKVIDNQTRRVMRGTTDTHWCVRVFVCLQHEVIGLRVTLRHAVAEVSDTTYTYSHTISFCMCVCVSLFASQTQSFVLLFFFLYV